MERGQQEGGKEGRGEGTLILISLPNQTALMVWHLTATYTHTAICTEFFFLPTVRFPGYHKLCHASLCHFFLLFATTNWILSLNLLLIVKS